MTNIIENEEMSEEFVEEDLMRDLYLSFEVNKEDYAIGASKVKEIITMSEITLVPYTPNYVKGIINLRGDIVPVIDVRTRFGMEETDYNDLTCIVVLEFDDYIIGLIVDRVKVVQIIPEEDIVPPPQAKLTYENQFVRSVCRASDGVKLLLDIDRLLF